MQLGAPSAIERRLMPRKLRVPRSAQQAFQLKEKGAPPPEIPTTAQAAGELGAGYELPQSVRDPSPTERSPYRDAIGRALVGFSRGFNATPQSAAYNGPLAGLAGGLSAIGQEFQDEEARREKEQAPARALRQMIVEESVRRQVRDPYDQAQEERAQANREKLQRLRGEQEIEQLRLAGLLRPKPARRPTIAEQIAELKRAREGASTPGAPQAASADQPRFSATATGPNGEKIGFNPVTKQWERLNGR